MPYVKDPRVDAYIDALPEWQQAICRQVREIVHDADPEVEETIKRSVQPYFVLHGNVCALLAAKNHVNIFLYDGAIVPDPEGIITAGHNNKTCRMISIYPGGPSGACLGPQNDVPNTSSPTTAPAALAEAQARLIVRVATAPP